MAATHADSRTTEAIRELPERSDRARTTRRAERDLWAENLTKEDVCDAICGWIEARRPVEEITTEHVPEHKGEPAYVMMPRINDVDFYVKVTIIDAGEWKEKLLIISTHRPNW